MSTQQQKWDRLPTESVAAFVAFQVFRDLGPGRSLAGAYRAKSERPDATPTGGFRRLARDHDWIARAEAYDGFLDLARQRGMEAEAVKAGETWELRRQDQLERNYQISLTLLKQAERLANMPVTRITKSEDGMITVIEALPPSTLRAASAVSQAAASLAWAVIREAQEQDDDGFDVSNASTEALQNYLERCNERRNRKRTT